MKPAAAAPRRGGRRAAIVASLLVSHGAIFGLGYSWHSLWGDYVAPPTHLAPTGGGAAAVSGAGALDAFLAPPVRAGDASVAGAAGGVAAGAGDARARAASAKAAGDALRAAAAKAAALSAAAGGGGAAAAAAGGAAALSPPPAPSEPTAAAATPVPALKAGEPGRVAELGEGGTEAWLDKVTPFIVNNTAIYTWTNFHMRDFLLNFLLHMKEHGITSFLVGAMDPELHKYLVEIAPGLGMVIPVLSLNAGLQTGDYGWNSPAFKRMAKYKFQAVQQLLSRGVDVIVADTDTAWVRNPLPALAALPEPDILTSTDVLRRMPLREQLHSTLNIGIMLFRARPGAIAFVTTFYEEMVNDPAFGTGNAEWDQARFNRMVREGMQQGGPTQDWVAGWGGRVKVQALDIVDFPNGHVYFAQRLPQALGRVPFIVHATFQYGGTPGKRHRFREWRLWKSDPETYYDPPGGLLAYEPTIDPALLGNASLSIETHFALMNPQLSQLRAAWGLARALGRVLVMPRFTCGMDRVWFPHDGVFPGSDPLFTVPFEPCPMDHILDTEAMERNGMLDGIREWSLLDNEKLPARVKASTAVLDWVSADPNIAKDTPMITDDGTQLLPRGVTAGDARTLLAPHAAKRLLLFKTMPPGAQAFGGFEDAAEARQFEEQIRMVPAMWCCIDERKAKERGQPFPPGQTWYDLQWDIVPHTDRFNRRWDGPWTVKLGP